MKSYRFQITTIIIFIVLTSVHLFALGPPPKMRVKIFTTDPVFRLNKDPIKIHMILANAGADKIITRKDFETSNFHRMLHFRYDDGRVVVARPESNLPKEYSEAPLPIQMAVKFDGDSKFKPVILESREELDNNGGGGGGWGIHTIISDASDLYDFPGTGKMTIGIKIPMTTYARTVPGTGLVQLCIDDTSNDCWQGVLKLPERSREAHRICLVEDTDTDGYYYPCPYPKNAKMDCDDSDSTVNPGVSEIQGNGKDDDCNPATPD